MRSKALLVGDVLATLWSVCLLALVVAFVANDGIELLSNINILADAFDMVESASTMVILNTVFALLGLHTVLFVLGTVLGWIGFAVKKAGVAKAAAILYLIATILCPVFLFCTLPSIIASFIGSSRQKKLLSNQ